LMRGYFRRPAGPGWGLLGDACHFKHPGTAQGIADAGEQAGHIGDSLSHADPRLAGYEQWRGAPGRGHYERSLRSGPGPHSTAAPGLAGYEPWREERAREHYDWSFVWGRFPHPESEALWRGWSTEPDAAQDLRDAFTRRVEPSLATSEDRLARWFAPGAPAD